MSSQGSTLNFGGSISNLRNISKTSSGAEINITSLSDTAHFYKAGVPDDSLTFELVDSTTSITVGETASAVAITWGSVTTSTALGAMVCTNVENNASVDEALTASVTLRRTK